MTKAAFRLAAALLLATGWIAGPLRAQTATATLDSTRITVGSTAMLRLEVRAPAGSIGWAQVPDSFGGLEVITRTQIDTVGQGSEVVYRQTLQITGFDSGLFQVPAFSFATSGGLLQTAPVPLLVETVPVDTAKPFRPIKDIIEVPASWTDYWPYALAGVLLLGTTLLYILFRRRRPRLTKPRPGESPSAAALRALAELEKSGLAGQGRMGEYFTRLSDAVRRYLEDAYRLPALEQPTDDLLKAVSRHAFLQEYLPRLRPFFQTADLAKFAKATPTADEAASALESARTFVQATAGERKRNADA